MAFITLLLIGVLSLPGCGWIGQTKCEDRTRKPCSEEQEGKYVCDECDVAWGCGAAGDERVYMQVPDDDFCKCIGDSGRIDTGICPWEY